MICIFYHQSRENYWPSAKIWIYFIVVGLLKKTERISQCKLSRLTTVAV